MASTTELPNDLISTGTLKIVDVICEGPISGFALQAGAYGNDPLTSTFYDNVPVRNQDGSYNFNVLGQGYKFYYTLGTAGQAAMSGFEKVENIVPLSSNTLISNPPLGAGAYKPVTATFNTTMYPDADSIRLTIRVPALYTQDADGNVNRYRMQYGVSISLNNGSFQVVDQGYIVGKCTSPYIETKVYTLPKRTPATSYNQWTVKVYRIDNDIQSSYTQNMMYVDSISVISSSSYTYPNTVLVGTYISADQFTSIPSRSYLIQGMLMSVPNGYTPTTYTTSGTIEPAAYPSVWAGDFKTGVWTDNPAWVFYDICTNKRYGLGRYIDPALMDKWSLYQISQYCDEMIDNGLGDGGTEPRFTCNAVLAQQDDAYSVLLNLSSVFRGMIYYANGTIQATQTSDKTSVYNYTNANVIGGQFNYADSSKNTRSTVAVVKWVDPSNLYRENVEYIEDTAGILRYGYNEKQVTAFACTSKGQAYRMGNWILQNEKLLTETISFRVGLEGLFIRPGDVFNVYDNFRNNRNQGGRIESFDSGRTVIELDRSVMIEPGLSYSLSAIVPTFNLNGTGEISNSSQIDLIQNSQIETYQVTTAATSGTTKLTVNNPFSTGLFQGSPWILSASGGGNIFNNASIYQCLAASEPEPGIFEIVGLQYNTGINRLVDHNYSVVNNPVNSGDQSPISAPSNLVVSPITGTLSDNTFYYYLQLNWNDSPSTNLAYYTLSGQEFGGSYQFVTNTTNNSAVYTTFNTGITKFRLAAVSVGGVYSSFITGSYTTPRVNPFGGISGASGLRLTRGADSNYLNSQGFATGYITNTPGFQWYIPLDASGQQHVTAQFFSGYKFSIRDLNDVVDLTPPVYLSGLNNTFYQVSGYQLGPTGRLFLAKVESMDYYGNLGSAVSLKVNNPVPLPTIASGFGAGGNGFSYSVTPNPKDIDISGIYMWSRESLPFTPVAYNADYKSTNLGGFFSNSTQNSYSVWFSLIDSFGESGCPIYGPIFVDALSGLSGINTQLDIIKNFLTLTGAIIDSGMNTLSAQISGVSGTASLAYAGVTGVQYAVAATGAALAAQVTTLTATVTGISATTTILSDAYVISGRAVSTYGFQLDANGKIVSLQAIAATGGSQPTVGTLILGGADMQSSNYSAGSNGWRVRYNGDVEFASGYFRGDIQASSVTANTITTDNIVSDAVIKPVTFFDNQDNRTTSQWTTYTKIASGTITTIGKPVLIMTAGTISGNSSVTFVKERLKRGSTVILTYDGFTGNNGGANYGIAAGNILPPMINFDQPGAGTYTYYLEAICRAPITNLSMILMEIRR